MKAVQYAPIGIIHSPFTEPKGTPIQPTAEETAAGRIEVFPEYEAGLRDLEGFSHIILLYHCHRASPFDLEVKPFLDDHVHGVFATCAPARPNAIGLSVVRLVEIVGATLRVRDLDVLDGAPLLDIKPYVPEFDVRQGTRTGWLEGRAGRLSVAKDDGRFSQE
jgi:tRNA-Thr(GGU) m(6)t(6)A37 methyltransferase TsaA